jgi:hypothetical protein
MPAPTTQDFAAVQPTSIPDRWEEPFSKAYHRFGIRNVSKMPKPLQVSLAFLEDITSL